MVRVTEAKRAIAVVSNNPASVAGVFDQPVTDEGRVSVPKAGTVRARRGRATVGVSVDESEQCPRFGIEICSHHRIVS